VQMRVRPSVRGLEDLVEGVEGDAERRRSRQMEARSTSTRTRYTTVSDRGGRRRDARRRPSEIAPRERRSSASFRVVELHAGNGLAEPHDLVRWLRLALSHGNASSIDSRV
jgi:hypothetical protein